MKHDTVNRASVLATRRDIFTHPTQILHSNSLPGFADKDQQTEVNQTLRNGGQQIALTICRRKSGFQKTFTFVHLVFEDFET